MDVKLVSSAGVVNTIDAGVKPWVNVSWLRVMAIGRDPRRTAIRAMILAVACLLMFKFVLLGVKVEGPSMMPNYRNGSPHVVNRLAYIFSTPQRGDVVTIRMAGTSMMFMKRIIGLPGEKVSFHKGHVFVNGKFLNEPYLKFPSDWELPPQTVRVNEYLVVGDNRSMPPEDHTFGQADVNRIIGKVIL